MDTSLRRPFGVTASGVPVEELTLDNGILSCQLLTYGGILRSLQVPDRRGVPVDVVLGFDTLEEYENQTYYIGALVGRCANRIAGGSFTLDGAHYSLAVNSGPNHLHGGTVGFDRRVWQVASLTREEAVLALTSPHGEEGYPGTLSVQVAYRLEGASLAIEYRAAAGRPTLCNLTNHSYFNLSGQGSGPVLDQLLQIHGENYTPLDANSVPTGQIAPVEGTPLDLRRLTPLGEHIQDPFPQLELARGYDHNWVIDGAAGTLRPAAAAFSPTTGISMVLSTTLPGVQLYTANYVEEGLPGKGGAVYGPRHAFCLETQFFPDAVHHPAFPSPVLRPGEEYRHTALFSFSAR